MLTHVMQGYRLNICVPLLIHMLKSNPLGGGWHMIVEVKVLVPHSCLNLATQRTVAHQAPLSMEFSRQEYWSRLPFSSPGDRPDPRIKPQSLAVKVDFLPSEPPGKPNRG